MATATEQALIDAYGDPTGTISQSIGDMLMNTYGGMVDVKAGQPTSPNYQLTPWSGPSAIGAFLTSDELERQRNMLDVLVAGGDLSAPTGYTSSVNTGAMPGHYIDSDTYGYQAGLKAALTRQMEGEKVTPELWKDVQIGKRFLKDALGRDSGTDAMFDARVSEGERAINAFNAAQQGDLSAADSYEEQISRAISTALADSIPIANMPGAYQVAQADSLINRAISDKPAGGLGSDDPHDMYNIRTQYPPGDIRYVGDQALLPNESVIPIDNTNQYTIPQTLPVNPLSQLMTTGALLGNALPGFKEDISSGLREFAPQGWKLNLPPALRKGVDKIKDLFTEYDPTLDAELTYQYNPRELGLDPFTRERVAESSNFLANLMAEGTEAQKTAIQRAISPGTAPYLRENLAAHFERDDADSPFMVDPSTGDPYEFASRAPIDMANILRTPEPEPTWFPPTTSSGIGGMVEEPASSPFIGDEGFTPSLPATTLGGPVVGETEQPIAQAVAQALANTDQPVQQNLQALAALAQTDPSIAARYVPGSQALQDITTQVESFSEPTVEWTPPAPDVPDISETLVDFSAIQSANEKAAQKEQDKIDRELKHAANVRRKDEKKARLAEARDKKAEAKKIAAEDKARKAEEKRISDKQAAEEKQRRANEVKFANMLKQANENHQAYLARKREEEARRKRLGYGVGDMWT